MRPVLPPSSLPRDENAGAFIYEARYRCTAPDAAAFDTWLRDRVADVLQCEGFIEAEILAEGDAAVAGVSARSVRYRLRDESAWRSFTDGGSTALEMLDTPAGVGEPERHTWQSREQFRRGAVSTENCLNCGEVLRGQHCLHCGQPARVRVLSLWSLLRDVLGDLLDWDGRIWRTLRPLALHPGQLTQEYLRGRRTYYAPPFRMYLILSVAFFLVTSVDSGIDAGAANDGVVVELGADKAAPEDPCGVESLRIELEALRNYEPQLRESCRRIVADQQGFASALIDNIPPMLFVFLPLIALLMQLLYAGSGRFYVEHLLFLVHFHSWLFLGALVIALLGLAERAAAANGFAGPIGAAGGMASLAYLLWSPRYLFVAMRRVYGQGRVLTLLKYALLGVGYLIGLALTMLALLVYTALGM